MFTKNDLVVRSIDFSWTLSFPDNGRVAHLKGLKLRTAETILLETDGRLRTRTARQLRVASTTMASLNGGGQVYGHVGLSTHRTTHLSFSWKAPRSRSKSPEASASILGRGIRGWSRGTRASEISFCSILYHRISTSRVSVSKYSSPTLGSAIMPAVWT